MSMSNIKRETIFEFIRYVYEEVQDEGWKTRKDELLARYGLQVNETETLKDFLEQHQLHMECEVKLDDMTFGRAMERYGIMDEVISSYLYPVLSSFEWMKAWMKEFKPELDEGKHLMMWDALCNFMYNWKVRSRVNEVKDFLGLEICLK